MNWHAYKCITDHKSTYTYKKSSPKKLTRYSHSVHINIEEMSNKKIKIFILLKISNYEFTGCCCLQEPKSNHSLQLVTIKLLSKYEAILFISTGETCDGN